MVPVQPMTRGLAASPNTADTKSVLDDMSAYTRYVV